MERMTVARVRSLSTPGRYAAGPTLYLKVAPGGSKSWVQRLMIDGRRHDIGLGGWPLVTLAEARDQAFENRRLVRRGGNPLGDKRKPKVPTFKQASGRALEANRGRWRNAKTADNWIATMAKYVYPVFGDRRVDQIGREDVLRVLTPIWSSKPERSDARSDSASARRWPGRRRTTTSRTTRPARRSTPRSRRRRRSRCTSARCRTPMSGRRSTSSRRHGRPCRRGRACGLWCSLPAGPVRPALRPGARSTLMPASGESRRRG